jgi:putative holliday junction resolvase
MSSGRVLALDVGNRRIGVAVSDPLGLLARGVATVRRQSTAQAVEEIVALVTHWEAVQVVVGLPINMDDTLGPQARRVIHFAEELEKRLTVPVEFWNEQLSTVAASDILRAQGVHARDQKSRIDAVAAAVILQEYLDARRADRGDFGLLPPDGGAANDEEREEP